MSGSLQRFTHPVDGTIPIPALLYRDEEEYASQDGVGIYDGTTKSPPHQLGSVYITSHRLFYIDSYNPEGCSFWLDLGAVGQTDYYAGLLRSSAKITLVLSGSAAHSGGSTSAAVVDFGGGHVEDGDNADANPEETLRDPGWECQVCAFQNPPTVGLSPSATQICSLCGVPRDAIPGPKASPSPAPTPSNNRTGTGPMAPVPVHPSSQLEGEQGTSCPACTFLNHRSLRECEICGTSLPSKAKKGVVSKSAPTSRPLTPKDTKEDGMIKISFRKGGDKTFYAVLKRSLKGKAWEERRVTRGVTPLGSGPGGSGAGAGRLGISGILQHVESSTMVQNQVMDDALQDLEALMIKARDMVKLAAELNERLTLASASAPVTPSPYNNPSNAAAEPEEATFIRSSLSQLGLQMGDSKPVTLDMLKDEKKWFEELARELAKVLQGPPALVRRDGEDEVITGGMMKDRGIIALDEVWGGWNRARGVALIPPATFLQVTPLLPSHTSPVIRQRTFQSGLVVLHSPRYTATAFSNRLCTLLVTEGPKTTLEIAEKEGIAVALAKDLVDDVEAEGGTCRDESGSAVVGASIEVRWWVNIFVGYIWDGQN